MIHTEREWLENHKQCGFELDAVDRRRLHLAWERQRALLGRAKYLINRCRRQWWKFWR
jgi:hypothetical protein